MGNGNIFRGESARGKGGQCMADGLKQVHAPKKRNTPKAAVMPA